MIKNLSRLVLNTVIFLAILFMNAGCQSSCSDASKKAEGDGAKTLAAVVNGSEISLLQLDGLHQKALDAMRRSGQQATADIEKKVRGGILFKLIDDEIVKQQAKEKSVELDRFERVAALEQYKTRIGGQGAFDVMLREQGMTQDQFVETIVADKIREKMIERINGKVEVTNDEISAHYEANKRIYTQPEMVKARHILLKLSKDEPAEKAAVVLKKANQVLEEAKDPRNSFESLVQKYSEGPSAKNGGDLGLFPRGRMVKAFEDAAFNAPLKTPVGPIQTDFGYHIIYVDEKTPARDAPLESVRDRIAEMVKRNKTSLAGEKLLSSWRKAAAIKIYDYSLTQEEYANLLDSAKAGAKKATQEGEPKS